MKSQKKHITMRKQESGYMFKMGKYHITITKEKQPVRLDRKLTKKSRIINFINENNRKVDIALFIILMLLFILLCYLVVPKTFGFYHW